MRRFLYVILLALLFCLASHPVLAAETVSIDGVLYELLDDHASIVGIEEGVTSITIHPEVKGSPTILLEETGTLGEGLEEVVFAEGITTLKAYHGLLGHVRHIVLPGSYSVEEKGGYSFFNSFIEHARYLETLTIPAEMSKEDFDTLVGWARAQYEYSVYAIREMHETMYYYNDDPVDPAVNRSLHSFKIHPDHPTLYDIDGIVYEKDTNVLLACAPGRVGAVNVPEGTTRIGESAFQNCDRIETIALPRSLAAIEKWAFLYCASLRTIQLPPTLETIGAYAFRNCDSLVTLVIPDGVTIEAWAFAFCLSLRAVYVQGNQSVIDASAFSRCHPDLVLYAKQDSPGYIAAAVAGVYWAEMGGEPVMLPSPNWVHQQPAYIHAEDETALLSLYDEPFTAANVVATLAVGTTVDVLAVQDGWAQIWCADGEGFLPLEQLWIVEDRLQYERILEVENDRRDIVQLYDAPSAQAKSITLDTRAYFPVIEQFGSWCRIDDDGTPRYVRIADYILHGMDMREPDTGIIICQTGETRAKLYAQATEDSQIIGEYYEGVQCLLLGYGDFTHAIVDGVEGYLLRKNLTSMRAVWFDYAY